MTDIHVYKLTSGDEVVGRYNEKESSERPGEIVLDKPRLVMIQPAPNGQLSIALLPWFATMPDASVSFNQDKVLALPLDDLPNELMNAYLQQTSDLDLTSGSSLRV